MHVVPRALGMVEGRIKDVYCTLNVNDVPQKVLNIDMVARERKLLLWKQNLCHLAYKRPWDPILQACEINSYQISQTQFRYKAPFIHLDVGLLLLLSLVSGLYFLIHT
jgi:hypothetical protein